MTARNISSAAFSTLSLDPLLSSQLIGTSTMDRLRRLHWYRRSMSNAQRVMPSAFWIFWSVFCVKSLLPHWVSRRLRKKRMRTRRLKVREAMRRLSGCGGLVVAPVIQREAMAPSCFFR